MELIQTPLDMLLHIDELLGDIVNFFGPWTYVILFLIIFAETGFVVTPFLPGDSLIFATGALAGSGYLNIFIAYFVLLAAAIIGDTINYWLGHFFGPKVFKSDNSKLLNKKHLDRTHAFYEKHGGKTIILARFIPIVRTFAPFVAGIGAMNYKTFFMYNVVGAFIWVTSLTFLGYYFGALEIVQRNFEYVIILIVIISVIPIGYEYGKHFLQKKGILKSKEDTYKKTSYKEIKESFDKKK